MGKHKKVHFLYFKSSQYRRKLWKSGSSIIEIIPHTLIKYVNLGHHDKDRRQREMKMRQNFLIKLLILFKIDRVQESTPLIIRDVEKKNNVSDTELYVFVHAGYVITCMDAAPDPSINKRKNSALKADVNIAQ